MKKNNKIKVAVAMSGGVDSSAAAALLVNQGYDVVGMFMKNWTQPIAGAKGTCPWIEDQKDVRRVCARLGIPSLTVDFEKEYTDRVVEYFFKEYEEGRTPNPDVMCNKEVKFDVFRKRARELGARYMATGHYARIERDGEGVTHLLKGVDDSKDQSYFLCKLGQEELQDTLFPIGHLEKKEVRELARKYGLATANKKDSQGICFIGPVKVREFLKTRLLIDDGPVKLDNGGIVAKHEGVWFYTIGQRLGASEVKWPTQDVPTLYVKGKDVKTNTLIVGLEDELYASGLICDNVNWVVKKPKLPSSYDVIIRYRSKPVKAVIEELGDKLKIVFDEKQRAVAPGQAVVIYEGEELIGSGVIVSAIGGQGVL